MHDEIRDPFDMKLLAARVLIVEDQIEAIDGVPDTQLMAHWCALMGKLRDLLCTGPTTRRCLRIPIGARVCVRRAGAKPTYFSCEDISYAGCKLYGDVSSLQVGDAVQLVEVGDSTSAFELAIDSTVVWHNSIAARRGRAGLKFAGVSGTEFNEFYLSAYKRFLNDLATTGQLPRMH
jgi:hypothetical protein